MPPPLKITYKPTLPESQINAIRRLFPARHTIADQTPSERAKKRVKGLWKTARHLA